MNKEYSYKEWLNYNSVSVTQLYNNLIDYNCNKFTREICSLNRFKYFCYLNSSKEKYKYL